MSNLTIPHFLAGHAPALTEDAAAKTSARPRRTPDVIASLTFAVPGIWRLESRRVGILPWQ